MFLLFVHITRLFYRQVCFICTYNPFVLWTKCFICTYNPFVLWTKCFIFKGLVDVLG